MALLIVAASLLALAHALGPQASCTVGQQCAAGEQDDTGMLQKSSRMMQVNRHEQMSVKTTPTNDAECEAVPGINTDEPIVYDSSCPGLCCFEDQPCRYNTTGCYSTALAQEGEDDAHERCRVRGRAGINTDSHRVRLHCPACAASRTSRAGTTPRAATPQPWRSRR
ncbi:unnamed protein product [Prorocentrum cordatum]|uniref:SREBP regulating gene protein n=1 Tax=Prorocentrum cordatum TaxID=2364126 RepID=A0ABN9RTE8_9DINO|nr:unnamed protein product [Polarella glacialis]